MSILAKYLKLDAKQQEHLLRWLVSLPEPDREEESETCTMDGTSFNVTMYTSGIGDVIIVSVVIGSLKYICPLSYDDDGELMPFMTRLL